MSSHELGSVVSVNFPMMILIPLAHIILPSSFRLDSRSLDVDLCICFHQLLDEGSIMTVRVVIILPHYRGRPVQTPSSLLLRVLVGVILVGSWEFP